MNPYKGVQTDKAIAWEEGFQIGLKQGFQIFCKHPAQAVESQLNEDEQYSVCTLCSKDLTKENNS